MKAKATALLLADLGVTKSHSRPYTSNDNPFSESHFKTLKYRFLRNMDSVCIEVMLLSCVEDQGRPLGIGFQERSNQSELLASA